MKLTDADFKIKLSNFSVVEAKTGPVLRFEITMELLVPPDHVYSCTLRGCLAGLRRNGSAYVMLPMTRSSSGKVFSVGEISADLENRIVAALQEHGYFEELGITVPKSQIVAANVPSAIEI